jgi:hypothetical protein
MLSTEEFLPKKSGDVKENKGESAAPAPLPPGFILLPWFNHCRLTGNLWSILIYLTENP